MTREASLKFSYGEGVLDFSAKEETGPLLLWRVLGSHSTLTAEFFIPQLHNAANANQKEKYEADLKKEIKKLQVRGLGLDSFCPVGGGMGRADCWVPGRRGH